MPSISEEDMRDNYRRWLADQGYTEKTISSRISDAQKVERLYGALDDLISAGGYDALIEELSYSTEDERRGRANPCRIQTDGHLRTNLASYKGAAALYRRFLTEADLAPGNPVGGSKPLVLPEGATGDAVSVEKQRLSLERDMQAALRRDIAQLEPGLRIIDDGAERYVTTGFINMLCKDAQDRVVVVEPKAGKADPRVIGQTLGYIGDLMDEDAVRDVRGIIVAHDFDQRTRSAARAVASLTLYTYEVAFTFQPV